MNKMDLTLFSLVIHLHVDVLTDLDIGVSISPQLAFIPSLSDSSTLSDRRHSLLQPIQSFDKIFPSFLL